MRNTSQIADPETDRPLHCALSRAAGLANDPKDFHWLEQNIPCQAACPAGTDIPGYLDAIAHGDYDAAYRINLRDNVFPAVLGRVCTRPCEPACRHGWDGLGEPVAICFSKRSAAQHQASREPVVLEALFPASGKKVAVVGAGAAGLAAARELARCGHEVTVYEQHDKPGGLMMLGIPPFRLPRAVVEREIDQVLRCGVELKCGIRVGRDLQVGDLLHEHDAVILAAGTLKPFVPEMPGKDLDGVHHGLPFLFEANEKEDMQVGDRVVVVGGGFTAVDCARTAHRLGASSVTVYYRRSEAEMYITPHEVVEMKNEGITFEPLVAPEAFEGDGGKLKAVRLVRTRLGKPDESGRCRPEAVAGSSFTVEADTVLLATGQVPDTGWMEDALAEELLDKKGHLLSKSEPATAVPGLFVAGDFASGADSLIDAVGHAKGCARAVDRFLMATDRFTDAVQIEDAETTGRSRDLDEIPVQTMPVRPVAERGLRDEVEQGYAAAEARTEASRCYLCHFKFEIDNDLCIYCDRCLKVKPMEGCIVKVSALDYDSVGRITGHKPSRGGRDYNLLYIDQEQCIRCGACADVCPVDCIPLQKVSRVTLTEG